MEVKKVRVIDTTTLDVMFECEEGDFIRLGHRRYYHEQHKFDKVQKCGKYIKLCLDGVYALINNHGQSVFSFEEDFEQIDVYASGCVCTGGGSRQFYDFLGAVHGCSELGDNYVIERYFPRGNKAVVRMLDKAGKRCYVLYSFKNEEIMQQLGCSYKAIKAMLH